MPSETSVIAHRGGAALAPENTIAAFDNGLALGADGLELDVRLSRDGVPVVHHDPTLERTTSGQGELAACSAEELSRVDAGHHFMRDGEFPFRGRGIGVPRLDDVLRRYPDIPLIIEMKGDSAELAEAVVDAVRKAGALDRAILASFKTRTLTAARRAAAGVRTGATTFEARSALCRAWCGLPPRKPAYVGLQLPEKSGWLRVVSPRFVRAVARAGVPVSVWVVDDEDDMRRLLSWGVTGLITDRPDIAVPLVRRQATGDRPQA